MGLSSLALDIIHRGFYSCLAGPTGGKRRRRRKEKSRKRKEKERKKKKSRNWKGTEHSLSKSDAF